MPREVEPLLPGVDWGQEPKVHDSVPKYIRDWFADAEAIGDRLLELPHATSFSVAELFFAGPLSPTTQDEDDEEPHE